ncbi:MULTISPECIES: helix-turn-helix domain-containing protein [Paenibacillus]|uniref:helix-turn-helix domain-containing protein n=1 Tax=Paenibacillus TaxID=44249 RepID=UPI001F22D3D4|nr:helix-turn-helix transcriptional regulator [Paenibacillus polymyxa]
MAVGKRVRELRTKKGFSQEELGEKAGFHFSYIGGLERAEKNITLLNLQKIADALDVQVLDLFLYTKYIKNEKNKKDQLLNQLHTKLFDMNSSELIKIQLLVSQIFDNK